MRAEKRVGPVTRVPHILLREENFKDKLDNICDIGNFRAHIFCPQATQELPKKHCEAEPPERLPTDALSQIDYGHTSNWEDRKEHFGKSE